MTLSLSILTAQYNPFGFIHLGIGTNGNISLNDINTLEFNTSIEIIGGFDSGVLLGYKYQIETNKFDEINHKVFVTVNISELYRTNYKNKAISFSAIPNFELGLEIDNLTICDYIIGLYWFNYYIDYNIMPIVINFIPSIDYSIISNEINIGFKVSILLGNTR